MKIKNKIIKFICCFNVTLGARLIGFIGIVSISNSIKRYMQLFFVVLKTHTPEICKLQYNKT